MHKPGSRWQTARGECQLEALVAGRQGLPPSRILFIGQSSRIRLVRLDGTEVAPGDPLMLPRHAHWPPGSLHAFAPLIGMQATLWTPSL